MPKEKLPTTNEQKIEEIKKAFTEPKRGASLGELRRTMRGGEVGPTEMTEAEKELAAGDDKAKPKKPAEKQQSPMEKLASRLMAEIKESRKQEELKKRIAKEAKRKELEQRYIAQFKKPQKPKPATRLAPARATETPITAEELTKRVEAAPSPDSARWRAEEAKIKFEEREAMMELNAEKKPHEEELSAPLESLPILEDEEIPGIEMPRSGRPQVRKPMPAPKKPWWKKAIAWLFN